MTALKRKPKAKLKTKPKGKMFAKPTPAHTAKTIERNEYGLRATSDMAIVLNEMIKGGKDKHEIAQRLQEMFKDQTTSGGNPKPISTVMNQVLNTFGDRGFTVESTWKFVPPPDGIKPPVRKKKAKATQASKKTKPKGKMLRRIKPRAKV